jgi:predicted nicotinamide N-methyase
MGSQFSRAVSVASAAGLAGILAGASMLAHTHYTPGYYIHNYFADVDTVLKIPENELTEFKKTGSAPIYGALTVTGTAQLLSTVATEGKIFYDLGSGVGLPIIAAARRFPGLKKLVGIELSQSRHKRAVQARNDLCSEKESAKITLLSKNMLEHPLDDADIVFISSLCFDVPFMEILGTYLNSQLKPGTIVMSSKEVTPLSPQFDDLPHARTMFYFPSQTARTMLIFQLPTMTRGGYEGRIVEVEMTWNNRHVLHRYKLFGDIESAATYSEECKRREEKKALELNKIREARLAANVKRLAQEPSDSESSDSGGEEGA